MPFTMPNYEFLSPSDLDAGVVKGAETMSGLAALSGLATELHSIMKESHRGETVLAVEATTGGLMNSILQVSPGASSYYHGGATVYGPIGYKLYPATLKRAIRDSHPNEKQRLNYASQQVCAHGRVALVFHL